MLHFWHMATAGIGLLVLAYGITAVCFVGLLAAAYFSPILKKDFLYAALCLVISTTVFTVGVHDESVRCIAQNKAAVADALKGSDDARDAAVAEVKQQMAEEKLRAAAPVSGHNLPWVHAPARSVRHNGDKYNRDTK